MMDKAKSKYSTSLSLIWNFYNDVLSRAPQHYATHYSKKYKQIREAKEV